LVLLRFVQVEPEAKESNMSKPENLIGKKFGRLTVVEQAKSEKYGTVWNCLCACGKAVNGVRTGTLHSRAAAISCGCLKSELVSARSFVDLTGQRFGRLVVLSCSGRNDVQQALWELRCDCGNTVSGMTTDRLRGHHTRSCGCLQREAVAATGRACKTHGCSRMPDYAIWKAMVNRCNNPDCKNYHLYGGRGIKVCDRWQGETGPAFFMADMGPRPSKKHSIDRYPNQNGNYEPKNCRWATAKQQANNSRANRLIECGGETMTIAEWAERTGLARSKISYRLAHGWTASEALTTKADGRRKRKRKTT
jgi:hypothetical protein